METFTHSQQRSAKLSRIRQTLSVNPLLAGNKQKLEEKLQKNRARRNSVSLIDKELSISKTFQDIQENIQLLRSPFKQKYEFGKKRGEGAHGVVKQCYQKVSGKLYAVKILKIQREHIHYLKQNFKAIKELNHPNIPCYQQLFFQLKTSLCYLIMDYLPYEDLEKVQVQTEQQLKTIVYQILITLQYLHSHKICHRDIKPENILFDKKSKRIFLIDFGVSKKLEDRGRKRDMLTVTGTPFYRAPQMFEGGGYDQMVDMWALGITIYKLIAKITPFQSTYHSQTIENIMKADLVFPQHIEQRYSQSLKNLIRRFLKRNKNQRLTAEEALKDVWFYEVTKKKDELTRSLTTLKQALQFNGNHSAQLKFQNFHKEQKQKDKENNINQYSKSINFIFQDGNQSIFGIEDPDQPETI